MGFMDTLFYSPIGIGKKTKSGSNGFSNELAQQSRLLFGETTPARAELMNRFSTFLGAPQGGGAPAPAPLGAPSGIADLVTQAAQPPQPEAVAGSTGGPTDPFRVDPSASPLFAPGKFAIERNFRNAREDILSSLPEGGELLEALAQADVSKAGNLAGLEADISQDFFNKMMAMISGQTQQGISGLGTAAGLDVQRQGQQAQIDQAASAQRNDLLSTMAMMAMFI